MSLSANYPTVGPVLNLDFINNNALDPRVTFTRASTATYFDYAGVLQTAQNNVPRFDFNPSTLVQNGLLIEESRTNSIRNNTMQGAVAGTPGTLPTNWGGSTTVDGLAREIVAIGTQNGVNYIDVRYSGTSGTGGSQILITFDSTTQVAATNGQTWTPSVFLSVVGGSTTNVNALTIRHRYYNNVGTALVGQDTSVLSTISSTLQRFSGTAFTAADALTAYTMFLINADFVNSSAVDITLRIGLPQLEQGAFATSVIPTTTTALTRQADVASMTGTNLTSWFNAVAGTLYAEGQIATGIGTAPAVFAGLDDTTINNRMQLRRQSPGTVGDFRFVSSGGNFTGTATVGTLNGINKLIGAYVASDQSGAANGTLMTGIVSVATLPTVTRLALGDGQGSTPLNGWLRRISYYNYRVPNAQLQALTGS